MSNERIELLVKRAFKIAEELEHEYVTLEHILCVVCEDQDVIDLLSEMSVDATVICDYAYQYVATQLDEIKTEPVRSPKKTITLERMFNRAFTQALFAGRQHITAVDLLLSTLAERNSTAAHICNEHGVTREAVIEYLSENGNVLEPTAEQQSKKPNPDKILSKYTINLNKEAEKKRLDPLPTSSV